MTDQKAMSRKQIVGLVEESLRSYTDDWTQKEWNDVLRYWKTAPIAEIRGEAEITLGWKV